MLALPSLRDREREAHALPFRAEQRSRLLTGHRLPRELRSGSNQRHPMGALALVLSTVNQYGLDTEGDSTCAG